MSADYGYHYNICMAESPADALSVMNEYTHSGYEAFSVFVDPKTNIINVCLRRPMTADERTLENQRRRRLKR